MFATWTERALPNHGRSMKDIASWSETRPIATPRRHDSWPMLEDVLCTERALAPDTKAVILETWLSVLAHRCAIQVSSKRGVHAVIDLAPASS